MSSNIRKTTLGTNTSLPTPYNFLTTPCQPSLWQYNHQWSIQSSQALWGKQTPSCHVYSSFHSLNLSNLSQAKAKPKPSQSQAKANHKSWCDSQVAFFINQSFASSINQFNWTPYQTQHHHKHHQHQHQHHQQHQPTPTTRQTTPSSSHLAQHGMLITHQTNNFLSAPKSKMYCKVNLLLSIVIVNCNCNCNCNCN